MKRIGYSILASAALVALAAGLATATPNANGAYLKFRVFNDAPFSTVTSTNNYPALIQISDQNINASGFANLHIWRFSDDGGANAAVFDNNSCFSFGADLVLDGTGHGEGGLQIAPWWAKDTDGLFNVRTTDGEIAVFGGRLPFFTFSNPATPPPFGGGFSLQYVKGTTIRLEMIYNPNGLSSSNPATVEYRVHYGGNTYSSGLRPFDQGNPAEDPPYGLWGMLNDGRVGGHYKAFLGGVGNTVGLTATWSNISYTTCDKPVPAKSTTWGRMKSLYR
uniref:Uncharacterized protein n=1 Tax=Eiseniibacteriota bacterium TaxID=2212470 RepID=A0A832I252_UNCEI